MSKLEWFIYFTNRFETETEEAKMFANPDDPVPAEFDAQVQAKFSAHINAQFHWMQISISSVEKP